MTIRMARLAVAMVLLSAIPVAGQEAPSSRWQDVLLIAGGGLAGADLSISMDAFSRGQAREANPLLRPLVNRPAAFGAVKAGLDTAAILWLRSMRRDHPKRALIGAVGFVVLKASIVAWNVKQLRR